MNKSMNIQKNHSCMHVYVCMNICIQQFKVYYINTHENLRENIRVTVDVMVFTVYIP